MFKRFDKKKFFKVSKFNILLLIFIILILIIPLTFSRYESEVTSDFGIKTAIYVLDDAYTEVNVDLPDIIPSNNQYAYTFSVSNFKEDLRTQTNLTYDLWIRTTTNIPLTFDLFNTLDYQTASSIVTSNEVTTDDDGTYFREIRTATKSFSNGEDEIEYYTLLITFPKEYNESIYHSLIELIEINIESKQLLSTDS